MQVAAEGEHGWVQPLPYPDGITPEAFEGWNDGVGRRHRVP
uniref:Uncharacterized protein n=1 Tax=Arundo donax TaxID=35708 RepID=A0A0A9B703_ARUDO